jgi:hypothetical protein
VSDFSVGGRGHQCHPVVLIERPCDLWRSHHRSRPLIEDAKVTKGDFPIVPAASSTNCHA